MKYNLLNVLFLVTLTAVKCSGQQLKAPNTNVSIHLVEDSYNEKQLGRLLTNGMSAADLTNKFGSPEFVWTEFGQIHVLSYRFRRPILETNRQYLTGFDVRIKEDRVVSWSPGIAERGEDPLRGAVFHSVGTQSFRLFIGHNNLSNLVDMVRSNGTVDAAVLTMPPDMVFESETFITKSEKKSIKLQTLLISIGEEDVPKLKNLTAKNIGKPLLIVCGKKIIAAPTIQEALGTTNFTLTIRDTNIFK